jgi:expansin (peptidoglycan-binding protein)
MRLVYKGDLDWDLIAGPVVVELSYDGDDIKQGSWTFWNVRVKDHRFGGTGFVGPGSFHDWLELHARDERGHLPDEPDAA